MSIRTIDNVRFENAQILWPNFSGRPDKYNPQGGKITFGVKIPDDKVAQSMIDDGWNVKIRAPQEEGDVAFHYMNVEAKYGKYPPAIYMVTRRNGPVLLDETTIGTLDGAEIKSADLEVRPYCYDDEHVKAYVKSMYVVIEEDAFAAKYANWGAGSV